MLKNRKNLYLILTLLLSGLIFGAMLAVRVYTHDRHEFVRHGLRAVQMLTAFNTVPAFIVAHPFYQVLIILLITVFKIDLRAAAILISLGGQLWLAAIIYNAVYPSLDALWLQAGRLSRGALALLLTLTLMLVSHIPFLVFVDRQTYFGYIGFNAYNSPTTNIIKPASLLLFIYGAQALQGTFQSGWRVAWSAALTVCSTLAKPNFVICLLPGLAAFAGLDFLRLGWQVFKKLDWRWIIVGAALPAGAVLAWQYWLTFQAGGSSIIVSPFSMMLFYSDYLLVKLLASILFPLAVTTFYWKDALRQRPFQLAWVMFAVGAFYTYFLATDAGGNIEDGNFAWSSEVTLFVLFVAAALFWLERKAAAALDRKDRLLLGILALHLLSGIFYYVYSIRVDEWSFFPSLRTLLGL